MVPIPWPCCDGSTRPTIPSSATMATTARSGRSRRDELARAPHLLPPLEPIANAASPFGLAWLADRLRQPDGCPWDREQDHRSLRPFLLEETYEVYDALDGGSTPTLAEELGDLLLQVVLHAQYAAEDGVFDLADVQRAIMTKIVRRHPHVFGDVEAATATDVMRNWEQLKAAERAAAPTSAPTVDRRDPGMPAAFAGLSKSAAGAGLRRRDAGVARPRSATTGPTSRASSTRSPRRRASCWRRGRRGRARGGVRRPPVRHRQPRPQAGHRPRGGAPRRESQVRVALRARRADRRIERGCRAAGPGPRRARRAVAGGRRPQERETEHEHRRRHALSRRRAHAGPAAPGIDRAGRPEVGGRLARLSPGRHARPLLGDARGPHPAAPARQGHRLGHRRVRDAAGRDLGADAARIGARQARRPHVRDPAARRPLAAGRREHGRARRAHRDDRLRRAPGRRRHALRVDHRRVRRARAGAPQERARARRS